MKCPHCEHELTMEELRDELTTEELKSLWARYTSSLATPHAGPGRPRWKKRCRCGEMTLDRAKQRNHKCPPRAKKAA